MDSPIHPDLQPTPRPHPSTIPMPFPLRNDPLIQGHDIELAPRPFEETTRNPTPEVLPPSHPELAVGGGDHKPAQPHPYALALEEHDVLPKAWADAKSLGYGGGGSRPGSPHSQSVSQYTGHGHNHGHGHGHAYSVATTAPMSAGSAVGVLPPHLARHHSGQGGRYSYTDFSSPFDRSPLVDPPPPGGGQGGGGGKRGVGGLLGGGEGAPICGVRRQLFWVGLAIGVFLVVVAVAVGVGVGVGLSGGGDR